MRKTFKFFCAVAVALLAVSSCGKIEDSLHQLEQGLENLTQRVKDLEDKLNDEVATLNSKIGAVETAFKAADAELLASLQAKDTELAASITSLIAQLDALDGKVDGYIESNDKALEAAIAQYQADLKELGDEMTEADKKLADADASILAALVNVGVTKVEKDADGNAVLTFTDGSTLVVGAYDSNANNTGVVTVVTGEDGVKYWAVILEDGTTQSLEVPVGHVELQFMVDPETKALLYSVDGGANWEETGAYVADSEYNLFSDFYQGGEMNFDTWEYELNDYFTLVFGGEEYYLPVYKADNSVVTIKAGKTYFAYEEVKAVEIALTDITSIYVMNKPDGWKAKLENKVLTVTAPTEAAVTDGTADADGEVLLHCTTTEGKCKIAKLEVATTAGFSLTVDAEGNVTIVNPVLVSSMDEMGEPTYDFNDAYVGLAPISKFAADPVAYVNGCQNNWEDPIYMIANWKSNTMDWETGELTVGGRYVAGEYEVDIINTTVAQMYSDFRYGAEMERGSHFVVWACPVDSKGAPIADDLVYAFYAPVEVIIEAEEPAFNDVALSLELYGADSFLVGKVQKEYAVDNMTGQQGLDIYVMNGLANMQWGNILGMFVEPGEHEYNLSEVVSEWEEAAKLNPETEYYFFVIPVTEGKAWEDYTFDEVVYETYTTAGLSTGGTLSATFEAEEGYVDLSVTITADAGADRVYYSFFETEVANEMSDDEKKAYLLGEDGYVFAGETYQLYKERLAQETSYTVIALVVDSEGKYGELVEETFTTKKLVYSETFKAAIDWSVVVSGNKYTPVIDVTVEGGTAAKYYYYWNASVRTEEQLNTLPLLDYYYYFDSTTFPTLTWSTWNTKYQFAVVVESETGEFSKPVSVVIEKPAEFAAGDWYIVTDGKIMTPLAADKNYGYPPVTETEGDAANAFTFTAVDGGYTIQDASDRYYYMKGTYNSVNVDATLPEEGGVWTVTLNSWDSKGTHYAVVNTYNSKTLQYSSQYNSYGIYTDVTATLPSLVSAAVAEE